jgi:hypothetical protein
MAHYADKIAEMSPGTRQGYCDCKGETTYFMAHYPEQGVQIDAMADEEGVLVLFLGGQDGQDINQFTATCAAPLSHLVLHAVRELVLESARPDVLAVALMQFGFRDKDGLTLARLPAGPLTPERPN